MIPPPAICGVCGALAGDIARHQWFHQKLADTLKGLVTLATPGGISEEQWDKLVQAAVKGQQEGT